MTDFATSDAKPVGKRRAPSRVVYFIEAEGSGLIKIGRATNPDRRLAELQIGSAESLRLLKVVEHPDARALEADLHRRFAEHRVRGEWFAPSPELRRLTGPSPALTSDERRHLGRSAAAKVAAFRGA